MEVLALIAWIAAMGAVFIIWVFVAFIFICFVLSIYTFFKLGKDYDHDGWKE